ncbi:heat shock 70 kda protein 14-like [Plakobranchus ocellatus]|uniref:Heat shock 70 kDa protein 14-like n=1 Tax=Plakobranchus ocellatus TaxID=259542 RepID=A0AAV3XYT9_9GAST|nr:heat shock 70 kda protein 14-like [Plakobranchus ocellatus]
MAAFGLHFGTCSACLAVYRDGKTNVVANDLGDRVTPCVVAFTEHEAVVGAAAKQGIIRNASNTVCHVKGLLGCRYEDPQTTEYIKTSTVNVLNQDGMPIFEVDHMGKPAKFSPTDIMEIIYKKMLETAQSHGGSGIQDAVLAVPPEFDMKQRDLVTNAATKAGFNILRVITEPSAALLAFDVGQLDHTERFKTLVYRLGGTSHEAVVMEVEHGMYRTVAKVSDSQFGGDVFTQVLQAFLMSEFNRQCRCDMKDNKRSVAKLGLAAERCKHSLSTMITAQCAVDSLYDGCDFHYNMSRARFDSLCLPLLPKCAALIEQALKEADCCKDDISKLIICGGGAKPPVVKKAICDFLPNAALLNSVPEDEIIAIGAAKQAALLVGGVESDNVSIDKESPLVNFKFLPRAVCIKTGNEDLEVVLPQHSLAPSRRQHTLTLPQAQTDVALEVFQADDPANPEAAQLLAKLIMRDLPPGSTIKSNFHLKREGDLHITCHEVTSDQCQSVTIPCS